ncbi:hypothetical protein [Bacteroidetes bacterium endosymbiont of Geopemphigus sp.]|uniref:hypothetical protein n=1 Tax=Bacteroidetes bacterium endosymbiont of Geopemphigus sp. TaxID=2047937 RepID=UPI0018A84E94|nr:hypothetical protein [Bacteroidetes bacterium endosymbiont of Geopemphigus sp.]
MLINIPLEILVTIPFIGNPSDKAQIAARLVGISDKHSACSGLAIAYYNVAIDKKNEYR